MSRRRRADWLKVYCGMFLLAVMIVTQYDDIFAGQTVVLESGDLPYTTVQASDTLQISGTKISSSANGILISHNDILLDFGVGANRDTLEFNTGGNNTRYGVKIGNSQTGLHIRGGQILNSGDSIDYDGYGIWLNGGQDVILDSVNVWTSGFETMALYCDNDGGEFENIYVRGCSLIAAGNGMVSREFFDCAGIWLQWPDANTGSDSTMIVDGCYIYSNHVGITMKYDGADTVIYALTEIKNNTIVVDARNDLYDGTNQAGDFTKGSANASCVSIEGAAPGTSIHDNTFLADSAFFGVDVMVGFNASAGTESEPIDVYNNRFIGWRGRDPHYNENQGLTLVGKGIKVRQFSGDPTVNKWIRMYDNVLTMYAKGGDATNIGHSCECFGFQWWWDYENEIDSNIHVFNNTCSTLVLSEGAGADTVHLVAGVNIITNGNGTHMANQAGDSLWGNTYVTAKYVYSLGLAVTDGGDGGTTALHNYSDTIKSFPDTVDNPAVITWGQADNSTGPNTLGNTKNILRDLFFVGSDVDDTREEYITGDDSSNYKLQRTLNINVTQGGSPVQSAACSVWNSYAGDILVGSGTTDASGDFSTIVTYEWQTSGGGGDSLRATFNDFTLKAIKGADSAMDASFTVGWTAAGGNKDFTFDAEAAARTYFKGFKK